MDHVMRALACIDESSCAVSDRLRELVQLPTVNPPGECYDDIVRLLTMWCEELGMTVTVHPVPDAEVEAAGIDPSYRRSNLIARWDVGASRTVHFNAHYDVVPASGKWKFGAFTPTVENGWFYGRGAGDMKGSIAAILTALAGLRSGGCRPAVNVECSFTADEETGGELGAGYIVRRGLLDADCAIVCEGASGTKVGLGHNGVLWLEVHIAGKSAHGSNPDQGRNAFESMVAIAGNLQVTKRELSSPAKSYRDFNGKDRYPTINLGGVFGGSGQKINTVPGDAWFTIDRRIPPNERLKQVERHLRSAVAQAAAAVPQARCRVTSSLRIDPCVMGRDHSLPQAFAEVIRAVRRRRAEFRVTTGFTDLHYFIEAGLPGIGYGVDGKRAHAIDERVRVRDILQTARTYAQFMLRGW